MADLSVLGGGRSSDPAGEPAQVLAAEVRKAPAAALGELTVVFADDKAHEVQVRAWSPRDNHLPAAGDIAYMAIADDGEWVLVAWRPAA